MLTVLAALAAANALLAQSPYRFLVALDAAHGGEDSGARLAAAHLPEKAVTLALSVKLRSLLTARGVAAVTTREQDVNPDPARRADLLGRWSPQACLSLHAAETGSGVHLFVLSPSLAERARPGLSAAAKAAKSAALAKVLRTNLQNAGFSVTLGQAPLASLASFPCPAVALELAPERGPDQKLLSPVDNPGYQTRLAETLAAALLEWRAISEKTP